MSRQLAYAVFQTEAGGMAVMASAKGLVRLTLPHPSSEQALDSLGEQGRRAARSDDQFAGLAARLRSYFRGVRTSFPDRLDLSAATPFHQSVWKAARHIPYGQTRSYGDLAGEIGRPGSARAVGQAMARNPVAIIIPCHRVVASGGKLGGFGGRPELKWHLLTLEAGITPVRIR